MRIIGPSGGHAPYDGDVGGDLQVETHALLEHLRRVGGLIMIRVQAEVHALLRAQRQPQTKHIRGRVGRVCGAA